MASLPKVIVIVGPTGVGKTALSLTLAQEFKGEILSADSRQIYRELNIGSGKPSGTHKNLNGQDVYQVSGVNHFGLDFISPDEPYSVADFKAYAEPVLDQILARNSVPFVVGGTGLYVSALVNNLSLPKVLPNQEERSRLEALSLNELLDLLKTKDQAGFEFVDKNNKRRVIRALEIAEDENQSIAKREKFPPRYQFLQIGLNLDRAELLKQIDTRIDGQVGQGFLAEAKNLLAKYDPNLPSLSGIGYGEWQRFLTGEYTESEAIKAIKIATHQYAKRQLTWFKRDPRIRWFASNDLTSLEAEIEEFLALP